MKLIDRHAYPEELKEKATYWHYYYDATVVMQDDGKQTNFSLEFAKRSMKE